MFKGDLKKIYGVWHVIYSRENSGRIQEIELTDYSSRAISEKKGDNIQYLQDVYFDITNDGRAALNFFPDPPHPTPSKMTKEGAKTKSSQLREWIDEGCAVVKLEEQEKQKASKESLDELMLRDIPIPPKHNKAPFSTSEELTMKHLISAYEEFSHLEQTHPSDITDFVFHIHALQRILGQRVLRRDYPNTFPTHQ